MTATWIRLEYGTREVCASASHDHDVSADWRMESGGIGSYHCDACRLMIDRGRRYDPGARTTARAPETETQAVGAVPWGTKAKRWSGPCGSV